MTVSADGDLTSKVGYYLRHQFEPVPNPCAPRLLRRAPLLALAVVVAWNLWSLRGTTLPVAHLNDGSVHEEMVRFATKVIDAGRLPFTSWFPYTGLGSAQFLRYQGLSAALAGLVGTVLGAGTTFRWSIYLLVALWPFAIYGSARVFGLRRRVALAAALLSSFMVSHTGIGYERGAYSWTGGAEVWTQLLGSWTLPFAWATTWRAMKDARLAWAASALVGITVALHFESGYLGLLAVIVIALVAPGPLRGRLVRGAVLFAGSLVAAAWVIVPLLVFASTSTVNQPLANTPYVKGYGARQVLGWLFTGQVFDARRRVPVISMIVLAGALLALAAWKQAPVARAFLALFAASLLLGFGPTTWGPLADLVPAHADLYFRRFQMGAQLAGIYMAGAGAAWGWDTARRLAATFTESRRLQRAALGCVAAGAAGWCWPAYHEIASYDHNNAAILALQRQSDTTEGSTIAPLIAYVKAHGHGRTYAGLPSNWGQTFRVGYVPVYKYLESQDVDEMTYVVPSLSLMLDAEADFDEFNPADYPIFGIRYLLLPAGMTTPVPAREVMVRGNYALWQISSNGYVDLVQLTGTVSSDRADIGTRSLAFLQGLTPNEDWAVQWPGLPAPASVPGLPTSSAPAAMGVVDSVRPALAQGALRTEVTLNRPGDLLLSVAYDPGWHAWVDGHPVGTEMLAPALVGVALSGGTHDVVFRYEGFGWYPELWGLGLLVLSGIGLLGRVERKGVAYAQA